VNFVADSSPLIILAKINCLDFLNRVFVRIYISPEVYREVVVAGAGRPGAEEVENADWIETVELQDGAALLAAQEKFAIGAGELSTILLANEMHADAVLIDDYAARRIAKTEGLAVLGTVGLLEVFYSRGHLADIRAAYRQLAAHSYIDARILNDRLRAIGISPI
jgi:predicted nucleic acid-binding protein